MVLFLNDHMSILLLIACALLLLCSALLFIVLRRQSKHAQHTKSDQHAAEKAISDHLSNTAALLESRLREEMNRQEATLLAAQAENTRDLMQYTDALNQRFDILSQTQEMRLHRIAATLDEKLSANDQRTEKLRESLAESMHKLQKENAEKLEKMRQTVDEKLHETLNRRLGESFSLVNERLEQVYKGLGEMQTLASGVGDLKKVLTNVKTRGIWGEVQLGSLLEQMLAADQFAENVQVAPHTRERVEFAVILPGKEDSHTVYLPIDSKFPVESYERLLSAVEIGDTSLISAATNELEQSIRTEAKRIAGKYNHPHFIVLHLVHQLRNQSFGFLQAAWLHILGKHRVRNIECYNHFNALTLNGFQSRTKLRTSQQNSKQTNCNEHYPELHIRAVFRCIRH